MKHSLVAVLLLAALCAGPVQAQPHGQRDRPLAGDRLAGPAREGLSADEAARRAQQQYGGRVLGVRPEGPGFRVKLLKDGEVRTVYMGP